MVIRRAGRGDGPALARLLAVQLTEHHVAIPAAELATAIDGVITVPARGFFLVAFPDGDGNDACIGVAFVSFIWTLEHGGHSGWLEELYVTPEHREGGVGTRLLEATMAEATAAGCAALDLEIDSGHERVRSLYRRHGFTDLPRRRVVKKLKPE